MLEYAWMTMTVGADWTKVSWSITELCCITIGHHCVQLIEKLVCFFAPRTWSCKGLVSARTIGKFEPYMGRGVTKCSDPLCMCIIVYMVGCVVTASITNREPQQLLI